MFRFHRSSPIPGDSKGFTAASMTGSRIAGMTTTKERHWTDPHGQPGIATYTSCAVVPSAVPRKPFGPPPACGLVPPIGSSI